VSKCKVCVVLELSPDVSWRWDKFAKLADLTPLQECGSSLGRLHCSQDALRKAAEPSGLILTVAVSVGASVVMVKSQNFMTVTLRSTPSGFANGVGCKVDFSCCTLQLVRLVRFRQAGHPWQINLVPVR
jgi:hypothetical protein